MRCPVCKEDNDRVIDSRPMDDGAIIRRRRECNNCKRRFTTYEKLEYLPLIVVKKDGTREAFDRDKLMNSVLKSCSKRPISAEDISQMVDNIEGRLHNLLKREIPSRAIGELVMDSLKDMDEVAYVRFASVYRQFTDLEGFQQILGSLYENKKRENEELNGGKNE